jgi:Fic family protein
MRLESVLQRIRGEYLEMPGLTLTAAQAQRLWGLDRDTCTSLLAALVDAKFLKTTRDGAYIRFDDTAPARPSPTLRRRRLESVA